MQITVSDLGPNDMYVELTREKTGSGEWVRIKMGYKGNPPVLNTGVSLNDSLAVSYALQAIAPH